MRRPCYCSGPKLDHGKQKHNKTNYIQMHARSPARRKLSILHYCNDLSTTSGGLASTVPVLCESLQRNHIAVTLATLKTPLSPEVHRAVKSGVSLTTPTRPSLTAKYNLLTGNHFLSQVHAHDVVHIHGIWSPLDTLVARSARRLKKPVIISLHGAILPNALRKKRYKKLMAMAVYVRRTLESATQVIVTSIAEQESARSYCTNPVITLVPHGVTAAESEYYPPLTHDDEQRLASLPSKRIAAFLSRIEPIKGLPDLLIAWRSIADLHPDWHLVVAGPSEDNYGEVIKDTIRRLKLKDCVTLFGPAYGNLKEAFLERCELFIQPSLSENFGMAIAEALARGKPVITTQATPWEQLSDYNCGWWVPCGGKTLASALKVALNVKTPELKEMGLRGKHWVLGEYSWEKAALLTENVYRNAVGAS